ncbi:cytochrome c biogenesis protein CcdA [Oscillatoria sp. CS-180]|uniref:cytochrome c biogenesis protein CcdA n=1 Tax=Oscillatoria sp. CS-180 TaxID=3021720 RepID=UPI00232BC421|nr:cytochrome c biogenesis protein CcdA [Oscillatoria sp. CS-180]MDB9526908.1 cytochrome c biogenesis protein CcdA [Oscillatoria sp. CS-180]
MFETLQTTLYEVSQYANTLVSQQLTSISVVSLGVVWLAGLLTSLTPCTLSMLPIMVGYMGGYEAKGRFQAIAQSSWFALGLATTLAALGLIAGAIGRVYGQVGVGLPIIVSVLAILMGLNLLEALPLPMPSIGNTDFLNEGLPLALKSYLLGLTFGLVASPCSTPVLATILAWISTTGDPVLGAALLLAYTVGYVSPLVIAGSFTATIKRFLEIRRWSGWITPASGILLVGFGVFSLLLRLVPSQLV